ncbi:MAG: TonB-dependent receptor [Bryobacterales bacterium]|nr:TonB-dependent receptor [Bryobacterales bacterium]
MVLVRIVSSLFLLCLVPAWAQSPLGIVTGLALDPSGAAIPNAVVDLGNTQTGVKRHALTNAAGVYSFPNLPPGAYKLEAQAKDFRALATAEFPVEAYRTVRQDLRFELEAAATEVTITESASTVIQVETPSIGSRLLTRQILELPTNQRSVYNNSGDSGLIALIMPLTIPGVVQVGSGAKWLTPGGLAAATKLKVDGIETNFGNFGSPDPVSQPSMESIEEFTASVLTNKAEFGGMGTITTVTRAGTNGYHGDLFWYFRNSALDAWNVIAQNKPYQNIHNYGGTLGGPIRRDRTFFHFTFDGISGRRAYVFSPSVPTLAMREGDFTGFAALRNPFSGVQPIQGNKILPQFISPQAKKIQELFYPEPNYGPPTQTTGNYRASFNGPETHRIFELRLDHNFSSRHGGFIRYQHKKDDYDIPGARSSLPPSSTGTSDNIRRVNFWTLGDIYSIRPNVWNEFRAGVVILVSESDADLKGQALLDQIGIQGLPSRGGLKGIPNFNITGITTVTQTLLNPVNDGHWQLADNLSWVSGRHSMKFGAEVVDWFVNRHLPTERNLFGNYVFNPRFTGNAYADFLLGLPAQVNRLDPYPTQYNRFRDWAFYAQDDFKATPRLSLNYGLRYEYNGPVWTRLDNLYSFDPASGRIVVPGEESRRMFSPYFPAALPLTTASEVGLDRSLRKADTNNFAPRFGFSYQLDGRGRTVVRGGWGVFYSHFSANVAAALAAGPYAVSTTAINAFSGGKPLYTLENPFAQPGTSGTVNVTSVNPNLRNSYAMQYSLSVERELTRDIGVRLSYIGSKGTQLVYQRNANQVSASTTPFSATRRPYPQFFDIAWADNGANSLYSAMQAQVQKRFSKGLLFSSAWTWAKSVSEIDDTGDFELNTLIEDAYDRRRDRANVYSVPRHQWMNQLLYELPLGGGNLRGGWQVNALWNLSTGNFLNPIFSGSDPSNTNRFTGRPDVEGPLELPKTWERWFEPKAFAIPPANAGRFGNAGRNTIPGPGYMVFNLGVSKTVRLENRGALSVTASWQNLFNRRNWGEPFATVNDLRAGSITSLHPFLPANSPRSGMLSLRWRF